MEEKILVQANSNGRRRRVLVFPIPLQGHLNPMLQLADILYTKGFSITIIHTLFNSPNPSNYPHFTFKSIDDASSTAVIGTENDHLVNVAHRLNFLNQSCVKPLSDCLADLLEEDPNIACLITDPNWSFTPAVIDAYKLPLILLKTSSLSSFLVHAAAPIYLYIKTGKHVLAVHRTGVLLVLLEKGYFNQDSNPEAQVSEFPALKLKDVRNIATNSEAFCNYISTIDKVTRSASAIIWNTFRELEEPAFAAACNEYSFPSFPIGPFHKRIPASSSSLQEQDRSIIHWLDLQLPNSVVYASFGSIVQKNEAEFKEMARGLANSEQPFLWTVRPAFVKGSEWLEFLPDGFLEEVSGRGRIIKWAPQQEVLAHPAIGSFWTHCGWNSTLESICEGVPMICSPCFGDQPIISRYVHDVWQIGMYLENGLESGDIETAIKRVMVDEEGKEMRKRVNVLKKKANLCLDQGGSSYQSIDSLADFILSRKRIAANSELDSKARSSNAPRSPNSK